jgi:hypothetical protein
VGVGTKRGEKAKKIYQICFSSKNRTFLNWQGHLGHLN